MTPHCPNDGLPMSLADGGHLDQPYWTCDGPNDNTTGKGCYGTLPLLTGFLTRDITAKDLAVDSPEPGEGYPPDHVIGPAGSAVTIVDDEDSEWIEVMDFANDPFVQAFVNRADITIQEPPE